MDTIDGVAPDQEIQMDGDSRHEPDSGLIATGAQSPAGNSRLAFLFAVPGALDIIVCDEPDEADEQLPRAA